MSITRRTRRVGIDGFDDDRISNLSKELTDEILTWLPIRDAVKTSLLSKDWRYKWASMPNLVFEASSIHAVEEEQRRDKLVNFVNQALLLHNGTVSLFKLDNFLHTGSSDVDRWIVVLSRKMVKHLFLNFNRSSTRYCLPGSLFSCQFLKRLKLEFCELRLSSQLEELRCLTELELTSVILTTDTLETLVVKNPLLQVLKVKCCKSLTHFNINAPNLETVVIAGSYTSFKFQNTPKVTRATIIVQSSIQFEDGVLEGLDALQRLYLCYVLSRKILPVGASLERLKVTYHHLTFINIYVDFECSKAVTDLLCLLRSSPILKTLNLIAKSFPVHLDDENVAWEAPEPTIFHHLNDVRFDNFKGLEQELKLTKFILSKAVVLGTFNIIWNGSVVVDDKLTLVMNMMQFQRASSKVKFIFN